MQLFNEFAVKVESWIASKEAFLANDDLGDSLDSVQNLMKKHDAFEKTVTVQEAEKMEQLNAMVESLLQKDPDNSDYVRKRRDDISRQHQQLLRYNIHL